MVKKLPKQTDKVRGDSTWPFPTKLLTQEPKKVKRKKVDTTQYEGALF
jgi:hypothetical protein